MQNSTEYPTCLSEAADGMAAVALRAGAWAHEPFLQPSEDASEALGPGTARRRALDEAVAELAAGLPAPSAQWKTKFALMLGLERVLSDPAPHLLSGIELRRHQIDALAGMLTELISLNQQDPEGLDEPEPEPDEDEDAEDEGDDTNGGSDGESDGDLDDGPASARDDPGAVRLLEN